MVQAVGSCLGVHVRRRVVLPGFEHAGNAVGQRHQIGTGGSSAQFFLRTAAVLDIAWINQRSRRQASVP